MQDSSLPYFHTLSSEESTYSGKEDAQEDSFCYAAFAALIHVKTAGDLQDYRWGFNLGVLLEEAIRRQRLFIESQHFPHELGYSENNNHQDPPPRRTFSIRCINSPGTDSLQLALLGRVSAGDEEEAKKAAKEYWYELKTTFPFDYTLEPAIERPYFMQLSGWEILDKATSTGQFAEITKYENYFQNNYYLLGGWNTAATANEQIWRVLVGAEQKLIYDVSIRPTILTYEDLKTAYHQVKDSKDRLENTDDEYSVWIQHGLDQWQRFMKEVKHPYLVQIRIASDEELPEYLARTIGFAHAHSHDIKPAIASFSVTQPAAQEDIGNWRHQLRWLVLDTQAGEHIRPEMYRLRKMVNAQHALDLFRLPYPPKPGIPGVKFITTIKLN